MEEKCGAFSLYFLLVTYINAINHKIIKIFHQLSENY